MVFSEQPKTLDEATQQLPQGGYTTLRTYGGNMVLRLEDHFLRLEETARLAGKPLAVDRTRLRTALRQTAGWFPMPEKRVRVVVDMNLEPGTVYLIVEELRTPDPEDFRKGVKAVTRGMQRANPRAKLTSFISQAAEVRESLPPDVNEALMISEQGLVLEGLSSNFFGIRNGVLQTAGEGVLYGITRTLVLQVIEEAGYPLRLEALRLTEVPFLQEAFITSASRSVLPITEIDRTLVGNGRPGETTLAILARFTRALEENLEPL
jgi:branched-chain amino acid aminotransferase